MENGTQLQGLEAFPQPYRERLQATLRPMLRLTAAGPSASVLDSKVGGVPYRPRGMAWPTDTETGPLTLLAQLNFAALPPLPGFPTRGILQFFIGRTDVYGCTFLGTDQGEREVFQTRWFPDPGDDLTQLDTDPAGVPPLDEEFFSPLEAGAGGRLEGTLASQPLTAADRLFEGVVGLDLLDDAASPDPERTLGEWLEENGRELLGAGGHQLGGYPSFTQADPRGPDDPRILLLQLDSDDDLGLMWGDMGIANFFIYPEDLARCDFSRVAYNWDCG
ncbi:YwqG family protein [Deinococcus sp. Marseille-Q6407]|uniref:YwqG family protein n=1 Tax=Deinococcus sp. Marseille-Q6407 TaxID=2969223 RepID=UPI0021BEC7B9|nr:YwqG family protein [Deinococcus sp. Marseille-Q6407]